MALSVDRVSAWLQGGLAVLGAGVGGRGAEVGRAGRARARLGGGAAVRQTVGVLAHLGAGPLGLRGTSRSATRSCKGFPSVTGVSSALYSISGVLAL